LWKKIKKKIVESIAERIKRAEVLFLTDFTGLKVEQMTMLRQQMNDNGFEYVVVKNTLMKRAIKGQVASVLAEQLVGPNGFSLSYDNPVGLAKIIVDFVKSNPRMVIKAGLLSGKLINSEEIIELARIPSRERLLSMLLGVFQGVLRIIIILLVALPRSLINVLKGIEEKKAKQVA